MLDREFWQEGFGAVIIAWFACALLYLGIYCLSLIVNPR